MDPARPETTISNLSDDALKLVFAGLCLQDLKQCALVSKRWREQINSEIGFKLIVGKNRHHGPVFFDEPPPEFFGTPPNESRNYPVQLITQIGIQSCRIENLKKAEEVLPFKFPLLVKTLILDGKLLSRQWNILLEPLTNLSTLTISQFALLGLQRKQLKLEFPNLNSLIITGKPSPPNQLKWKQMIGTVVHVFKKAVTPRIQEIVLQKFAVKSSKQKDLIVLYLCRFIIRNKATLKKLSVVIQVDRYSDLKHSKLDKSLEAELERLNVGLLGLKLQSMFVQITMYESSRTQQMLRLILESQMHNQLKHIVWKYCENSVIHGFPDELVTRNHDSLETIEMDISPVQEYINCSVLANCTSLKYLTLIRGRSLEVQVHDGTIGPDDPKRIELTQTQLLPVSLVSIRICGLQVGNEDARLISILNLDVLELQNIGDSNGFGLPFSALQNIIVSHNIKFLSLSKCLNKDEGFVGAGAATISFNEICSSASIDEGYRHGGLHLQLIGQQYSPTFARNLNAESQSYYDYGTDPRSTYFKNLTLQLPKTLADSWGQWGPVEIYLVPLETTDEIDPTEEFEDEAEENNNDDGIEVVEEDLSDVDDDPNPEENSDGGEEENASEADDNAAANALIQEYWSYFDGDPNPEEENND